MKLLIILSLCLMGCTTFSDRLNGSTTLANRDANSKHKKAIELARQTNLKEPIPFHAELKQKGKNHYLLELYWLAKTPLDYHGIRVKDDNGKTYQALFSNMNLRNNTSGLGVCYIMFFGIEAKLANKPLKLCILDKERNRCSDYVDVTLKQSKPEEVNEKVLIDYSNGPVNSGPFVHVGEDDLATYLKVKGGIRGSDK